MNRLLLFHFILPLSSTFTVIPPVFLYSFLIYPWVTFFCLPSMAFPFCIFQYSTSPFFYCSHFFIPYSTCSSSLSPFSPLMVLIFSPNNFSSYLPILYSFPPHVIPYRLSLFPFPTTFIIPSAPSFISYFYLPISSFAYILAPFSFLHDQNFPFLTFSNSLPHSFLSFHLLSFLFCW